MSSGLGRDARGLEGLPLKLMVTSLVLALSAPALWGAVGYLQYSADINVAGRQAQEVREAASSAYVGGPGNLRTVHLDLPDGCTILLGGSEVDACAYLIQVLWKGAPASTIELTEPAFPILTGSPLALQGRTELRLECADGPGGHFIIAGEAR